MDKILDFITFGSLRSGAAGRKNPDDFFLDTMRQHADIWKECFTGYNVVCCPASTSLCEISREHLLSHVLQPDARGAGNYTTLRGETVSMSGFELACVAGFAESRRAKILHTTTLTDEATGRSTTVYYLSRPLVGGVTAPEGVDEISQQAMFRYVAVLRSFPEGRCTCTLLCDGRCGVFCCVCLCGRESLCMLGQPSACGSRGPICPSLLSLFLAVPISSFSAALRSCPLASLRPCAPAPC